MLQKDFTFIAPVELAWEAHGGVLGISLHATTQQTPFGFSGLSNAAPARPPSRRTAGGLLSKAHFEILMKCGRSRACGRSWRPSQALRMTPLVLLTLAET